MQVKWGKLAVKVTVWLTAEILLSLAGLDNLADYGEFTAGDHPIVQQPLAQISWVMPQPNVYLSN